MLYQVLGRDKHILNTRNWLRSMETLLFFFSSFIISFDFHLVDTTEKETNWIAQVRKHFDIDSIEYLVCKCMNFIFFSHWKWVQMVNEHTQTISRQNILFFFFFSQKGEEEEEKKPKRARNGE